MLSRSLTFIISTAKRPCFTISTAHSPLKYSSFNSQYFSFPPIYSHYRTMSTKTEAEWRTQLNSEQFRVLRQKVSLHYISS